MTEKTSSSSKASLLEVLTGYTDTSAISGFTLHPSLVAAYRLRVVAVGSFITSSILVNVLVYMAIDTGGRLASGGALAVLGVGVGLLGSIVLMPWNRILVSKWALKALYAWSCSMLLLAGIAVYANGGGTSVMFAQFPILAVFFAIAYPRRAQLALFGIGVAIYLLAVGLRGWNVSAADMYLRLSSLVIISYLASVLSGWLVTEMRERVSSTSAARERKDMLDTVARAARRIGSLDSSHVLSGALTGAIELGCREAEAWLLRGDPPALQLQRRISIDAKTYDDGFIEDVFVEVQRAGTQILRTRSGRVIACPLFCEGLKAGLLVARMGEVGSDEELLVECIELLAAQVSAGLDVAQNVAERRGLEEQLAHWAFHDSLTDLPNRVLFADRLELALARAARDNSDLAVLFLDLDGFKEVNDTLGHAAGDEMLRAVAARVQTCLRPNDTLARHGGDEFVILVEQVEGIASAERVAERVLSALETPIIIADSRLDIRTSIGIAITRARPGAESDVVRRADMAMYEAKSRGGSTYVVSSESSGKI